MTQICWLRRFNLEFVSFFCLFLLDLYVLSIYLSCLIADRQVLAYTGDQIQTLYNVSRINCFDAVEMLGFSLLYLTGNHFTVQTEM